MHAESVPTSDAVLARLRAETRTQHEAFDAALDLTSDTLTLQAYRHTLERFYGFYLPFELALVTVGGWVERGLDLTERQKTPLLATDMRALGLNDLARLPVCSDLPPHATVAAAFGCLYVLEGASLGGQVISRMLRKSLDIAPETGGSFFHGYGERTGPMWKAFRASIVAFSATPVHDDEIVSAAKDTFATLHRWVNVHDGTR